MKRQILALLLVLGLIAAAMLLAPNELDFLPSGNIEQAQRTGQHENP